MQEYLIILLATSLVLLVFFQLVSKSIPLSTRVIYCTVAISFILGATFPKAISKLTMDKVLGIYLGLIAFSAIALSYIESRFSKKINTAPNNHIPPVIPDVGLEPDAFAREEQLGPRAYTPELGPVVMLEHPVSDNMMDLPVTPTAQPDLPVDIMPDTDLQPTATDVIPDLDSSPVAMNYSPDLVLQPATPDVAPESEDIAEYEQPISCDDTPELSLIVGLEQPFSENMPDMPVALTAQPDLPVDIMPDLDLSPVPPDITSDIEDAPGDESSEQDYFKQVTTIGIINDCISAGFEAKSRGNLDDAVNYFFKAFRLNQGQKVTIVLAMEIASVYQELGQYLQAEMIINSVLEQDDLIHDFALKQKLKNQIIYLNTLVELLRTAKMSNAPYSKVPNLIKMKASIETSAKLTNLTKEAG